MTTTTDQFEGVLTFGEASARYKELFASADDDRARRSLQEELRLALVDLTIRSKGPYYWRSSEADGDRPVRRVSTTPRHTNPSAPARPTENSDGSMTITCRTCHEAKPLRAFPTRSGQPGVRLDRCRACRDAARGGAS